MQGLTIYKRKIYNYRSTHALVFKFLSKLIYDKNSLPQKFHNFWSTGTLDIKINKFECIQKHISNPYLNLQKYLLYKSRTYFS